MLTRLHATGRHGGDAAYACGAFRHTGAGAGVSGSADDDIGELLPQFWQKPARPYWRQFEDLEVVAPE